MKRIAIVLATLLFVVFGAGCASYDVSQDETAVEIDGYVMAKTDKKLVECHSAGKSGYGGTGNDMFYYNAGQRTFSFTGKSSETEMEPVPVVTSDSQTLRVPGFVKFTLTSECDSLYEFHQKVGLKYKAYTQEGWNRFLNDYLGTPITSALNDAAGDTPWKTLYQDASKRGDLERELNRVLQNKVNASVGGEWIKINGVVLSKPLASDTLVAGLEASEKQKLDNAAIEQKNTGLLTKYDSLRECRKAGISEQGCLTVYLSENGDIPFYPVPQGGNINVSPK